MDITHEWWPDYVNTVEGVARYCRAVEAEPKNAKVPGAIVVARTIAEMLEALSEPERCDCCHVPLADRDDRALMTPIDGDLSIYCTGCWSDIQAAIKARADLMARSLF